MYAHNIDDDTLERAAREAMTRPSDAAFFDERLYDTHGGPVISWADRGDDVLAESNYLTVTEYLEAVAEEEAPGEAYAIDAYCSHWAYGSVRELFVRVYDDDGNYTRTFREATAISVALREQYPVFDDSDFSERQYAQFEAALADSIARCGGDYADTVEQDRAISAATAAAITEAGSWWTADDVDDDDVEKAYRDARDGYFTALARAQYDLTDTMTPLV